MKHGLDFYAVALSLTLNSASSSLSDDGYLRNLNLKLPKTGCKFAERTFPILQN